jgi:hypothetical protein
LYFCDAHVLFGKNSRPINLLLGCDKKLRLAGASMGNEEAIQSDCQTAIDYRSDIGKTAATSARGE